MRRTGEWSPECFKVVARRKPEAMGDRFVGFNRRRVFVWFTFCRVTRFEPGREFAFLVSTFGLPMAEWSYRLTPESSGVRLTEQWRDLRAGRGARLKAFLTVVFTGSLPSRRPELNIESMRVTLEHLKTEIEGAAPPTP